MPAVTTKVIVAILFLVFAGDCIAWSDIHPEDYGAIGDGISDDSRALQRALKLCSNRGAVCRLSPNKSYRVTRPIFIWGQADLIGEAGSSTLIFDVDEAPYLFNVGISGKNNLKPPFSGLIQGVTFRIVSGKRGRLIYFWRTDGARVLGNTFDLGSFEYSATSSGNNNNWVRNGFKGCVRKNIEISRNTVIASADAKGNEGIGLSNFEGVLIRENSIHGVGDDPIGIHFSKDVLITNNALTSVDGRIFIGNSRNVRVSANSHSRIASPKDRKFRKGIGLIYVGFEKFTKHEHMAPTDIVVSENRLTYPKGAIDGGAAIYLYAPRGAKITDNVIINDSPKVKASAVHLLPIEFKQGWNDPDHIDAGKTAKVGSVEISGNSSLGKYPLRFLMTGNCEDYRGPVRVANNVAPRFQFYCAGVTQQDNTSTDRGVLR